jgi:peptidoglycan hydrolase-like protein with peptidoglycan-binding domain
VTKEQQTQSTSTKAQQRPLATRELTAVSASPATAALGKPGQLSRLPHHATARPLRHASIIQRQKHQGNAHVTRLLKESSVQRDLALDPPAEDVEDQPELTADGVERAIRYNRASYSQESIRIIQDVVGAEVTGEFNEETVHLIAQYQEEYGLDADGKVGATTYDLLTRELVAEGDDAPENSLTMFQIEGPMPLRFFRHTSNPNQATIGSHFKIHIRFDPRSNPGDWEYRQYIKGAVNWTDVSGATGNADGSFSDLPEGALSNSWQEDGDTAIAADTAGHHYGHRSYHPNPGDGRDQYLPDRPTGNIYEGFDYPELEPIPAAAADAGDRYNWEMNFRGVIIRKDHGVVEEKYWSIRGTITIPNASINQVDAT